jgi:7,8-dihydropterin-6-yl-methyl-4-(beta-D-ribofuranosyl)aminobenzene 5'-phosphate synthase
LETEKGVVLITGCAHPGIVEIVKTVKSLSDKPIYLALGGIHLFRKSEEDAKAIVQKLKALEIQYIAPSHCSGKDACRYCREIFGENYIDSSVGKNIEIE